ncbi:uncharacterized protein LOC131947700 [Physella acuta]|uniref:uncharacterized protein LOC131947700 n=1 Tax=Physella acuta TaxID=109671 RepID=UPI0027DE2268|nr:uncharacterized protein LOC131947700 [Physella acuta]
MYIAALLVCLPALVFCQTPDLDAIAAGAFTRMDVNKDGKILRPEIDEYFKTYDANGDSRISRHEYSTQVDADWAHDPQTNHVLHSLFDSLDTNNDNHLDTPDYDKLFAAADGDANGQVLEPEFARYFKSILGPAIGK